MTITLIEAALDAIYDYLKDNMPAKLIEINARHNDSITLENIKAWYLGELPLALPEYPSMCIRASAEELDVQRAINLQVKSYLDIVCFEGGEVVESRFRKLSRYAKAVVELIRAGEDVAEEDASDFILQVAGRISFSEVMESSPFLQGVIIPITAYRLETY